MRKATAISLILLLSVSLLFAEDKRVLDSETRVISAYKLGVSAETQVQVLTLRMMDTNNSEFEESEIISTPLEARDSDYSVFYWVLGGNVYNSVSLTFSFGPMWQNGLSSSGKYIPYTMTLSHISSKVGNSVLACNKASVSLPVSFLGYDFYYADSVSYPNSVSVSGSAQSATVTYDMSTSYTTVKKDGNVASYPYDVCSYWNRMGQAIIHLNINGNAVPEGSNTQLPDGMYYSNVVILITPNV